MNEEQLIEFLEKNLDLELETCWDTLTVSLKIKDNYIASSEVELSDMIRIYTDGQS